MVIVETIEQLHAIEGIHAAVHWFADVEMTVLYVDDGISEDTLNMRLALESNGTDGKHILSSARMNNSPNWWHSKASIGFEKSQLGVSKAAVFQLILFLSENLEEHILLNVFLHI